MQKELNLIVSPKEAANRKSITSLVLKELKIKEENISFLKILRRSIDARKQEIKINLKVLVVIDEPDFEYKMPLFEYADVSKKPEVIVVGAGPAGLFSALKLMELGFKPIVLERGKTVEERKLDIAQLNKEHVVNADSNYCFGEGGAGAFSDGKLFTRSKKKGNAERILQIFCHHGADENIVVDAHPHIGTDKLPKIISEIRNTILNAGGEIHFNARVVDFLIEENSIKGVLTQDKKEIRSSSVVLATGHSARDIYELFYEKKILLEPKSFAVGVRVEHSQKWVDSVQYSCEKRSEYLPPASYNLVQQVADRGVYSFCMCPGGTIVPAMTNEKEIVINGMSNSTRNSEFANSGIVVEVRQEDLDDYKEFGVLAGLRFQQAIEQQAFTNGGRGLVAPAQRVVDFVKNKLSSDLPKTSYYPGVISSPMHLWMPEQIVSRLQEALKKFNNKMRGYLTSYAIIIGVESRTSAPVRIPRDKESLQHLEIKGLFPCGEGAGYSGGIVSSAIDGERCAEKVVEFLSN